VRPGFLIDDRRTAVQEGAPGAADRWLADRLQRRIGPVGVRFELWDGSSSWRGETAPIGTIVANDRGALLALLFNPDLQFGEMYSAGRVDVRGVLHRVLEALGRMPRRRDLTMREWFALHFPRTNDLLRAQRNVHHHYDLGNDFYRLWLDDQLLYTCAYFPQPDASLEEAQVAKMDLVCRKLRLQPGESVLEAGCGWGALALHMARRYGVRVKAFNISREQMRYARARAAEEGLADRVEFIAEDYRSAQGRFDVFVSVGMLEHVGRRQYRALADVIARTLDPVHGRGLLHFIGRDRPRPLNAWIARRIFPGGHPPALSELQRPIFEHAKLSVLDVDNLRLHYARTLTHWRERFERVERHVRESVGDAFFRAWYLYLAGSEAAFTTGWLQLYQIVFAPAAAVPPHWTRAEVYAADGAGDARAPL
jgi:cyclopropane-fatty-acyl-phospholipid synthase